MSIATLAQSLDTAATEFRILPTGAFRAWDGRPEGLPSWQMNSVIAARMCAARAEREALVIDFEHQTLRAKENGNPAPAAGWCNRLAWREGLGLFAVEVKWTEKAKQMIGAGEYRFISPVFSYSATTGEVDDVQSIALTNNPGLIGLTDLALLTADQQKPIIPASISADDAASLRWAFPNTFADDPGSIAAQLTADRQKTSLPASISADDAAKLRRAFPNTFADW